MSELIQNGAAGRKELLKGLILQLHGGAAPAAVKDQLVRVMGQVPYGLVVEVEQELLAGGLPQEEVTKLCHLHGEALEGAVDLSAAKLVPPGHPVDVFRAENAALRRELDAVDHLCERARALPADAAADEVALALRVRLHALADVDKHYLRKEHLLFPFLERHGITGPPKVMWTKHDEARALLRAAIAAVSGARSGAAVAAAASGAVRPAADALRQMTAREDDILLPMALDTLDEAEWVEVARQSAEVGFCLVEPETEWRAAAAAARAAGEEAAGRIRLPTGSFTVPELEAILNALPFDATFVDADDRVRYFTGGAERVFSRSRAVIGRQVQFCHPPSSVHTVEAILSAFKAGTQDRAAFWIELRGRFVHIEYRALRAADRKYLGCLEVTEDLTEKRALTGQRRLLEWDAPTATATPTSTATACAHWSVRTEQREPAPASRAPASAVEVRPAAAVRGPAMSPTRTFDARPYLARGEHPKDQVLASLDALAPGETLELVTPFPPAPLVEAAVTRGFAGETRAAGPGEFRTVFRRT
jgi:DUF438 domain-containing protein/uncharacterized protein (DUF2249 family)